MSDTVTTGAITLDNPAGDTIVCQLSVLRQIRGITQAQLAKEANRKQSWVSKLEANNDGKVSWKSLQDYAAALGYQLDVVIRRV